jgi:2-polyprenyl-6-methoxyphenol hydroxylase-like FAD-dependent oxidoreductase
VAAVAERVRQFDPIFAPFAAGLKDFKPFFPLEGVIRFVRDWARDGVLLIGDAAHTMSPAGAIGVNVALASAAVAAQVLLPHLGKGPIPHDALAEVQRLREDDVRTLHRLQLGAQGVLQRQSPRALAAAAVAPDLPALAAAPAGAAPHLLRGAAAAAGSRVQLPGAGAGAGGGLIASASPARRTPASLARPRPAAASSPGRTSR